MTKLYLITGFLGAGKTTFISRFAGLFPDRKIALIVNEFGKVGVDGTLLAEMLEGAPGAQHAEGQHAAAQHTSAQRASERIRMTEINNGSIFCACRIEQFEKAIRQIMGTGDSAGANGSGADSPDLIFVEASGLADPSAVRRIFRPGAFPNLRYAGAICLVDALRFHKVYQTARVCRMQLAVSDLVLINKVDLATRGQIDAITAVSKAQKPNRPVYETTYGQFDIRWLEELKRSRLRSSRTETRIEGHLKDVNLQKLTLTVSGFTAQSMEAFLRMFAEDTYRIKGFAELEGALWMIDCVGPLVELHPYGGRKPGVETGTLSVLSGHGLPARKSILEAIARFPECEAVLLP